MKNHLFTIKKSSDLIKYLKNNGLEELIIKFKEQGYLTAKDVIEGVNKLKFEVLGTPIPIIDPEYDLIGWKYDLED